MTYDVTKHILVPKHVKVSDSEKEKILDKFAANISQFPKIMKDDPAIVSLDVKYGDIIKVKHESKTAGEAFYYRVVIDG